MTIRFTRHLLLLSIVAFLLISPIAQADPPGGECPCEVDDPLYEMCAADNPVECGFEIPLTNGIQWLLLGGLFFALYSFGKQEKKGFRNAT